MKKIFFLFLFLYLQSNAQEIIQLKGKILDEKTGENLVFANILYPEKSLGFTTNSMGEFSFSLKASVKDSIVVSHIGYGKATYAIKDFLKLTNGIIKLKRTSVLLNEVVIVGKKESADALMKKLYKTYKKYSPKEPHIAEAYYVEKAKYDGKYVFLRGSIGYSFFMGNWFHTAAYSNYIFFCENTKISDIHPDWAKKTEEMNVVKYRDRLSARGNVNQFSRFERYGPLSKKHKEYDYKIDSSFIQNGIRFYKIAFEGEKMRGTVSFNSNNFQTAKVEYETIDLWAPIFHKPVEGKVSILFNYYDNVPFISKIKTDFTYQNFSLQNTLVILSQKFKSVSLTENEFWALNDVNFYIEYIPEKWSALELDAETNSEYELIQKDLFINNKTLEQQFRDNSGKWFDPKQADLGNPALLKIQELKNNF